jgi:elongation factor P
LPKACNLKKGHVVSINNLPYQVKQVEVHTPSARGANTLYKVRFTCVSTGQKLDQTFKGNDFLEDIELEKRPASFLYRDQRMYTFMDNDNYEQYTLTEDYLEEQVPWLVEGLQGIVVFLQNGVPLCIELPSSMELEIVETAPPIKGATVTSRTKPATLANGITVQVPEYISTGDVIQVNTETVKYMSRAKS